MKVKYLFVAALALAAMPAIAQETYQDTKLVNNELNGTARYVGMGGAMEALGADISTIGSNPAGIGLFRSSNISLSGGLVFQNGEHNNFSGPGNINASINGHRFNASFDQVGFVWTNRSGRNSFVNLAFNYHKSRNFDQILTAVGRLSGASQNKLSAIKYPMGDNVPWNRVDANYQKILEQTNEDNSKQMNYYDATAYAFGQYQKGYIGEYDFNVSGNINDRIYLGLTFGIYDVNYRSNSYYTENLVSDATSQSWETLKIDGTGFDVKLGAIFRPIESSPFRIGVYVNTPVFYDLSLDGYNDITMADAQGRSDEGNSVGYDFKVYTPWKFGVSLGHTVNNNLALGLTYEYSDYSSIDNRINDDDSYDWWTGEYYDDSSSDHAMNHHTEHALKGVHTVKFGVEYKPIRQLSLRAGYNFMSAVFDKKAFRDGFVDSPGSSIATSTDYTNWKATNRLTFGVGYQIGKVNVDLAYQYTKTDGDFYPFRSYYASDELHSNIATASKAKFMRNQLLLTVGYKF